MDANGTNAVGDIDDIFGDFSAASDEKDSYEEYSEGVKAEALNFFDSITIANTASTNCSNTTSRDNNNDTLLENIDSSGHKNFVEYEGSSSDILPISSSNVTMMDLLEIQSHLAVGEARKSIGDDLTQFDDTSVRNSADPPETSNPGDMLNDFLDPPPPKTATKDSFSLDIVGLPSQNFNETNDIFSHGSFNGSHSPLRYSLQHPHTAATSTQDDPYDLCATPHTDILECTETKPLETHPEDPFTRATQNIGSDCPVFLSAIEATSLPEVSIESITEKSLSWELESKTSEKIAFVSASFEDQFDTISSHEHSTHDFDAEVSGKATKVSNPFSSSEVEITFGHASPPLLLPRAQEQRQSFDDTAEPAISKRGSDDATQTLFPCEFRDTTSVLLSPVHQHVQVTEIFDVTLHSSCDLKKVSEDNFQTEWNASENSPLPASFQTEADATENEANITCVVTVDDISTGNNSVISDDISTENNSISSTQLQNMSPVLTSAFQDVHVEALTRARSENVQEFHKETQLSGDLEFNGNETTPSSKAPVLHDPKSKIVETSSDAFFSSNFESHSTSPFKRSSFVREGKDDLPPPHHVECTEAAPIDDFDNTNAVSAPTASLEGGEDVEMLTFQEHLRESSSNIQIDCSCDYASSMLRGAHSMEASAFAFITDPPVAMTVASTDNAAEVDDGFTFDEASGYLEINSPIDSGANCTVVESKHEDKTIVLLSHNRYSMENDHVAGVNVDDSRSSVYQDAFAAQISKNEEVWTAQATISSENDTIISAKPTTTTVGLVEGTTTNDTANRVGLVQNEPGNNYNPLLEKNSTSSTVEDDTYATLPATTIESDVVGAVVSVCIMSNDDEVGAVHTLSHGSLNKSVANTCGDTGWPSVQVPEENDFGFSDDFGDFSSFSDAAALSAHTIDDDDFGDFTQSTDSYGDFGSFSAAPPNHHVTNDTECRTLSQSSDFGSCVQVRNVMQGGIESCAANCLVLL